MAITITIAIIIDMSIMGGWDPLYRVQESVSLNSFGHQTRPGKGIFFKKITDDGRILKNIWPVTVQMVTDRDQFISED